MLRTLTTLFLCFCAVALTAQMTGPTGAVRYGNEWIDYDKTYLRIAVAEDGVYRLTPAELRAAGFSFPETNAAAWVLEHAGEPVPVVVDEAGLTFVGERNRGELDQFLFEAPGRMQLNDRYSMHTDTSVYYLSLGNKGLRYNTSEVAATGAPLGGILRESEAVFNEHYTKTFFRSAGSSIYYSHYDVADGFGMRSANDLLSSNGSTETTFSLPLPGTAGGAATLELRFGLGFDQHDQAILLDGKELTTHQSSGWSVEQFSLPFTASGESAEVALRGNRGDRDKANVAWARATYPATLSAAGLSHFLVPASAQNQTLELTDVGAVAGAVYLLNADRGTKLVGKVQAGSVQFTVPASSSSTEYYLVTGNNVLKSPALRSHTFQPALPTGSRTNYLILTSERLDGPELKAMAAYRASAAGGGYRVHTVRVEDLYDEYGYGVARHPMATRNYVAAARAANPELQYLFVIGKGREGLDIRTPGDLAAAQATFFVPSFGYPASDNLLTAKLGDVVPTLATGRLAATDRAEIANYLEKLREVEAQTNMGGQTLEDRDWMKQVIHLGGGGVIGEQNTIKSELRTLKSRIEASDMGSNVTSFFKTSDDPIETTQQDAIFDRINRGSAIITFFGHASSQGFDFSIDDPANYNNKGRYPYMLSLGCYSGDAFTASKSIGERFISLEDKGAIAFAASKGIGFISSLGTWGDKLYDLTGNELYGQGIGDVLRATISHFRNTSNYTVALLTEQFVLSGDPAYRIHPRPGPDVVVDAASVRFDPEVIPAQDPDFEVSFRVVNLGRNGGRDSIDVQFSQQLPGGEVREVYTQRILTPRYDEVVRTRIPNVGLEAVGQNRILISLDTEFDLAEAPLPGAESNNDLITGGRAGVPVTFIANTARTAAPPRFAVVNGPVTLYASTTDALAPEREYLLQVSRRRDFADPLLDTRLVSPGGIIREELNINFTDSTTYYWRVSPDSTFTEGAGYIWSESSFTWLEGTAGSLPHWAQQDPGQIVDGTFENIRADTINTGWSFAKNALGVRVFNAIYQDREMPRYMRGTQRLNSPFNWRIQSGMSVLVIDSVNNDQWSPNLGAGEYNTRPGVRTSTWNFDTRTQAGRDGMIRFIREEVPEGKYVLVWSLQRGNTLNYYNDDWTTDEAALGTTIFDLLEDEGALEISRLATSGSVPYALAFQKGFGLVGEVMARDVTDTVELSITLFGSWEEGTWTSAAAGPAQNWRSVSITSGTNNLEVSDSSIVKIMGQRADGAIVELDRIIHKFTDRRTLTVDLSRIDATVYRKVFTEIRLLDLSARTVPAITSLYFDYDGFGDVAVNPQLAFTQPDSLLQQGQAASLSVGYENISDVDLDSLLVQLQVINKQNQVVASTTRQAPVAAGTTGIVKFEVSTATIEGDVRFEMVLNPDQDQPEDVTFNNIINSGFQLAPDVTDPVLTVLFDGQRINDGDMVSGRPEIRIQLRDENQYLQLDASTKYQISLREPDGTTETLQLTDQRVEFSPATATDNMAEIFFRPEFLADGTYELAVTARDRSDNSTGRLQFKRSFEVINEMRVGNVLAYPNPFTTQTRFVYTLTGNEAPSTFRIQIMSVSGRVVRDIDLLATENLKVGTHQTQFAWDGTDEYGDALANGVYLYRVITGDAADVTLKKQDTGTDQYFERGLGKVVILR
ncbi:putative type IX secretion system sortase PorU2 [Neolewinella antarctica]|uniref:Gingipain domain-containing protein n=1 Tax=Neolewinella antarctica TaxID=442734 RepID=A0ABX0X8S5_9BACT|nr:C25 family cysteine peptidase [Neolewinella antarctica]NJC25393.1 hypothetical protein [Neolewinella antarctica]